MQRNERLSFLQTIIIIIFVIINVPSKGSSRQVKSSQFIVIWLFYYCLNIRFSIVKGLRLPSFLSLNYTFNSSLSTQFLRSKCPSHFLLIFFQVSSMVRTTISSLCILCVHLHWFTFEMLPILYLLSFVQSTFQFQVTQNSVENHWSITSSSLSSSVSTTVSSTY